MFFHKVGSGRLAMKTGLEQNTLLIPQQEVLCCSQVLRLNLYWRPPKLYRIFLLKTPTFLDYETLGTQRWQVLNYEVRVR